jgi:hypothetical protein
MIKSSCFREMLDLRNLRPLNQTLCDEIVERRLGLIFLCIGRLSPQRQIVFVLSVRICQAEHGLSHLVQQFLRTKEILPGRILSHMPVELAIIASDLLHVVFEHNQTQQRIIIRRTISFRNSQPFLVDVDFRHAIDSPRQFQISERRKYTLRTVCVNRPGVKTGNEHRSPHAKGRREISKADPP